MGRLPLRPPPSTLYRVQGVVRIHIIPTLGHLALADFSRLQAQQWASKLSATQSPGSVRKIVNVLSGGLQLAVDDWDRLPANPAARLKLPKQIKTRKKFLTHEQVEALAEAVDAKAAGGAGSSVSSSWCSRTPGCGGASCPDCACATSISIEDVSRFTAR